MLKQQKSQISHLKFNIKELFLRNAVKKDWHIWITLIYINNWHGIRNNLLLLFHNDEFKSMYTFTVFSRIISLKIR